MEIIKSMIQNICFVSIFDNIRVIQTVDHRKSSCSLKWSCDQCFTALPRNANFQKETKWEQNEWQNRKKNFLDLRYSSSFLRTVSNKRIQKQIPPQTCDLKMCRTRSTSPCCAAYISKVTPWESRRRRRPRVPGTAPGAAAALHITPSLGGFWKRGLRLIS